MVVEGLYEYRWRKDGCNFDGRRMKMVSNGRITGRGRDPLYLLVTIFSDMESRDQTGVTFVLAVK